VFMEPLGLNYVQLEHSATDSSLGSGMWRENIKMKVNIIKGSLTQQFDLLKTG
jgi:hypothetical protein